MKYDLDSLLDEDDSVAQARSGPDHAMDLDSLASAPLSLDSLLDDKPAQSRTDAVMAEWGKPDSTSQDSDDEKGDFFRGIGVSLKQTPMLAYGVAGLIGDTVGADGLKDWGLKGYMERAKGIAENSKPTDEWHNVWSNAKQGDIGSMVDFVQYGLGYGVGQMIETGAVAIGGAVVGGVAAGAPTVGAGAPAGAVTGAFLGIFSKGTVKAVAKKMVEKALMREAKTLVKQQLGKKVVKELGEEALEKKAKDALADAVLRKKVAKSIGSKIAVGANAFGQELGSIYPEAIEQAKREGRDLTGMDMARVWGTGIAAGMLEGAADILGVNLFTGKLSRGIDRAAGRVPGMSGKALGRAGRATVAGVAGFGVEGVTEVAQTSLERLGAGKDLLSEEAKIEYLNAGALGAVSGGGIGTLGGLISPSSLEDRGLSATADVIEELDAPAQPAANFSATIPVESTQPPQFSMPTSRKDTAATLPSDQGGFQGVLTRLLGSPKEGNEWLPYITERDFQLVADPQNKNRDLLMYSQADGAARPVGVAYNHTTQQFEALPESDLARFTQNGISMVVKPENLQQPVQQSPLPQTAQALDEAGVTEIPSENRSQAAAVDVQEAPSGAQQAGLSDANERQSAPTVDTSELDSRREPDMATVASPTNDAALKGASETQEPTYKKARIVMLEPIYEERILTNGTTETVESEREIEGFGAVDRNGNVVFKGTEGEVDSFIASENSSASTTEAETEPGASPTTTPNESESQRQGQGRPEGLQTPPVNPPVSGAPATDASLSPPAVAPTPAVGAATSPAPAASPSNPRDVISNSVQNVDLAPVQSAVDAALSGVPNPKVKAAMEARGNNVAELVTDAIHGKEDARQAVVALGRTPEVSAALQQATDQVLGSSTEGSVGTRAKRQAESFRSMVLSTPGGAKPTGVSLFARMFPQSDIVFDAKRHIYRVLGKVLPSVTTLKDKHPAFTFDKDDAARKASQNPRSKYYGKPVEVIKAQWEEDAKRGTAIHQEINRALTDPNYQPSPGVAAIVEMIRSRAKGEVLSEQFVWTENYAGTVDLLIPVGDNQFVMVDFKTLDRNPHTDNFFDTPVNGASKLDGYRVQLAAYAHALKQKGMVVTESIVLPIDRSTGEVFSKPQTSIQKSRGDQAISLIPADPTPSTQSFLEEIYINPFTNPESAAQTDPEVAPATWTPQPQEAKPAAVVETTVNEEGRIHITKEAWEEAKEQDGSKGRSFVDNRPLHVGALVTVGNQDGTKVSEMHVVTGQRIMPDGTVRHYLAKLDLANHARSRKTGLRQLRFYKPDPEVIDGLQDATKTIASAMASGNLASDNAVIGIMERLIRSRAGRMLGFEQADALLKKVNTRYIAMQMRSTRGMEGERGGVMRSRIYFNPRHYAGLLHERLESVDLSNEIGVQMVLEDMAALIDAVLLEETAHVHSAGTLEHASVVSAVKGVRKAAEQGGPSASWLTRAVNWRLQSNAQTALNEREALSRFDAMDENEQAAVMHELLAMLYGRMKRGVSVADAHAHAANWAKQLAGEKNQTLIRRLIELANRYFEGIRNFLSAQREIAALPQETQSLLQSLDRLMKDGGVRVPDSQAVVEGAVTKLSSDLDQMRAAAKSQAGLARIQSEVRDVITRIRLKHGDTAAPVTLNRSGELEMDAAFEAEYGDEMQPLLDALNTARRTDQAVRFMRAAEDLQLVLRQLNDWHSPLVQPIDRRGNMQVASMMSGGALQDEALDSVLRSAGMSSEEFMTSFNEARVAEMTAEGEQILSLQHSLRNLQESRLSLLASIPKEGDIVSKVQRLRKRLSSIRGASFPGVAQNSIVRKTIERLEIARSNDDQIAVARQEAILADHRATYPEDVDPLEFEQLRSELDAAEALLAERLEALERRKDDSGNLTLGAQEAVRLRKAELETTKVLAERQADNLAAFAAMPLHELIGRQAAHPGIINRILRRMGPNGDEIVRGVSRANSVLSSAHRLASFHSEFEWFVMGGRTPTSARVMGSLWGKMWKPATVPEGTTKINMGSLELPRLILGLRQREDWFLDENLGELAGTTSGSMSADSLTITWDGSDISRKVPYVQDADGNMVPDPSAYEGAVFGVSIDLANDITLNSEAASRMFGFEPLSWWKDENGNLMSSLDRMDMMQSNARVLNEQAVRSLQEARWSNHRAIPSDVAVTNGFSLGYTVDDEGRPNLRMPEHIIEPVDPSDAILEGLEGADRTVHALHSGAVAKTLVSIFTFVENQGGRDGFSTPLLSHDGGLTPAGLSWQAVAPKLVEFVALTRGLVIADNQGRNVNVYETLLQSLDKKDRPAFQRLYGGLMENLEVHFDGARTRLASKPADLMGYFWDLYRNAKVADGIYRDSMRIRRQLDELGALQPGEDFPLSLEAISSVEFQSGLRRVMAKADRDVLVASIMPVPARKFHEEWARVFNTKPEQLLKEVGDGEFVLTDYGDVNAEGTVDYREISMAREQAMLRAEERIEERKRVWRTSSLMALFGGDTDLVLDLVHSPEFASRTGDGRFNTGAIDAFILDQLSRFASEESARGIVVGDRNAVYDSAIRQLRKNHPEHEAMLNSLLANGGYVESTKGMPRLEREMFSPESFESDEVTLLESISAMIPSIAVVRGKARYELLQDRGQLVDAAQMELPLDSIPGYTAGKRLEGSAPRIPTVAFVSDRQAPTLVFPYGTNTTVSNEDVQRAITDMLKWLGESGQVDLSAPAQSILEVFRNRDGRFTDLFSALEADLTNRMREANQDWSESHDARKTALALIWPKVVEDGAAKALSRVNSPVSEMFMGNTRDESVTTEVAAEIIAIALVDPNVRKALVLSMGRDPGGTKPSAAKLAARGDLLSLSRLPGFFEATIGDVVSDTNQDFVPKNRSGVPLSPDDPDFITEARRMAEDALRESATGYVEEGVDPLEGLSDIGASPIASQQAEWAAQLLHNVLDAIELRVETWNQILERQSKEVERSPFEDEKAPVKTMLAPPGLIPRQNEAFGITEFEARQLLAAIDPVTMQGIIPELASSSSSWNHPSRPRLSAQQLMELSGESANRLREAFSAHVTMQRGQTSENQVFNYKTFSFTDLLDWQAHHGSIWHNARVRKGAVATAEILANKTGIADIITGEAGFERVIMSTQFDKLAKAALEAGVLRSVPDPKNPNGPEIDELTLARREYLEDLAKQKQHLDGLRQDIAKEDEMLRALENAIEDLNALGDELHGASDYDAFLSTLSSVRGISLEEGSLYDASPLIRMMFDDHTSLVHSMAKEIVANYQEGLGSFVGGLSLRRMVTPQFTGVLPAVPGGLKEERMPATAIEAALAAIPEVQEARENRVDPEVERKQAIAEVQRQRSRTIRGFQAREQAYDAWLESPPDKREPLPRAVVPKEAQDAILSRYEARLRELANTPIGTEVAAPDPAPGTSFRPSTEGFTSLHHEMSTISSVYRQDLASIEMDLSFGPMIDRLEAALSRIEQTPETANERALLEDRVKSARLALSRARRSFRWQVNHMARDVNSRIRGLVDPDQFRIWEDGLNTSQVVAAYKEMLGRLESRAGLLEMAQSAIARQVITDSSRYGRSNLSSMDLSPQARELVMVEIPEAARGDLVKALERGGKPAIVRGRVASILRKHVLPSQPVAEAATSALKARINERLNLPRSMNASSVMAAFEVASDLPEMTNLDQESRNRITLRVVRDLMEERKTSSRNDIRRRILSLAKDAARYDKRRSTIWASRNEGPRGLVLNGSDQDKAIAMRWLNKMGQRWSQNYMRLEDRKMADGFAEAESRARSADELLELGVDAMEMATAKSYRAVDNVVMPMLGLLDKEAAQNLRAHIKSLDSKAKLLGFADYADAVAKGGGAMLESTKEQAGSSAEAFGSWGPSTGPADMVLATSIPGTSHTKAMNRSDVIIENLRKNGMFGSTDATHASRRSEQAKLLGDARFDPHQAIEEDVRKRVGVLVKAHESGVLRGQLGLLPAESGIRSMPLHEQVEALLAGLEKGTDLDAVRRLHELSNEVIGFLHANENLEDVARGFIPGDLFKKGLDKTMINHDHLVRSLFAKAKSSIKAAFRALSMLDYGPLGGMGRDGFTGQKNAYMKMLGAAEKKLTGDNRYVEAATAYMYHQIRGYLSTGRNPQDRAEALLRGFDQADDGMANALAKGMPVDLGGKSFADVLKMPWNQLRKLGTKLTEPTYRMLEQQKVWTHLRDSFKPILAAVADGTMDVSDAVIEMDKLLTDQGRAYGNTVRDILENLKEAYIQQAQFAGHDVAPMRDKPAVAFNWRVFFRDKSLSDPPMLVSEMMDFERASWLVGPNRNPKRGEIHMLNINPFEAVASQVGDMLNRIHMQPAYGAFQSTVGAVRSMDGSLSLSAIGWMERLSDQKLGKLARDGTDASRAIAAVGQEMMLSGMAHEAPNNMIMGGVQKTTQLGYQSALFSLSQLFRQVIPGVAGYVLTYGNQFNWNYIPLLAQYATGRLRNRFAGRESNSLAHGIDWMSERYAPNAYQRDANGERVYYDDINRVVPKGDMRAPGRVTGKNRKAADALTGLPKALFKLGVNLGDLGLRYVLTKPESVAVRSMWAHHVTRRFNERRIAQGGPDTRPLTVAEVMDPSNPYHHEFDAEILGEANQVVTDIYAPSDPAKKNAPLNRQRNTVLGEIYRNMWGTFTNHIMHTAGGSYAAYKMMRYGDAEAKKAGARLMATNVGQNLLFHVIRFDMMAYLLTKAAAAMFDWDEDKEDRFHAALYGVDMEGEKSRFSTVWGWTSLLLGGIDPLGFSRKEGGFTEEEEAKDLKDFNFRMIKEASSQVPFARFGMAVSTAVGTDIYGYALKNTIMKVGDGRLGHYERSGIAIPERWGGSGMGPKADSGAEQMAYSLSKLFYNDISGRSTFTGGLSTLLDPIAYSANAGEEPSATDQLLLMLGSAPFVPREASTLTERWFQEKYESRIWAGSWER